MTKRNLAIFLAILLFAFPSVCGAVVPPPSTLEVMSYNIRTSEASDGTNSWNYRYPASAMMIMDQVPAVVGIQEATYIQVNYLSEYCDGYKGVGVGRDDGKKKGEYMAIFYNTKLVKLIKWGTFWLSETPNKPSQGWDGACKRSCTWALLQDKPSKKKFLFLNTHLDHEGVQARKEGLALIESKIKELNPDGLPVVLLGDFNMDQDAEEMKILDPTLKSARNTAFVSDKGATYNAWGRKEKASTIDHIYYSGFSSCMNFVIVNKPYMERNFISDHYPVRASLVF